MSLGPQKQQRIFQSEILGRLDCGEVRDAAAACTQVTLTARRWDYRSSRLLDGFWKLSRANPIHITRHSDSLVGASRLSGYQANLNNVRRKAPSPRGLWVLKPACGQAEQA